MLRLWLVLLSVCTSFAHAQRCEEYLLRGRFGQFKQNDPRLAQLGFDPDRVQPICGPVCLINIARAYSKEIGIGGQSNIALLDRLLSEYLRKSGVRGDIELRGLSEVEFIRLAHTFFADHGIKTDIHAVGVHEPDEYPRDALRMRRALLRANAPDTAVLIGYLYRRFEDVPPEIQSNPELLERYARRTRPANSSGHFVLVESVRRLDWGNLELRLNDPQQKLPQLLRTQSVPLLEERGSTLQLTGADDFGPVERNGRGTLVVRMLESVNVFQLRK